MLTRYIIEADGIKHEIPQRCVKNWDEIKCAYKRTDYSGITRSFTSQFEFVGEAYDMLMNLYLRDGVNAVAVLYLYTITDRWGLEERFAAPIDFTSITWNGYVLKVNCIDNSLAALIKANKSTKYEFTVGDEVETYKPLHFDRIPIENLFKVNIIGESNDEDASMTISFPNMREGKVVRIPVYDASGDSDILINRKIVWHDQTDEDDSYLIEAIENVTLELDAGFAVALTSRRDWVRGSIFANVVSNGTVIKSYTLWGLSGQYHYGQYGSNISDDLLSDINNIPAGPVDRTQYGDTRFIIATNSVWQVSQPFDEPYDENTPDEDIIWRDTGMTVEEFQNRMSYVHHTIPLKAGEKIWIGAHFDMGSYVSYNLTIISQDIKFTWVAIGDAEKIDTITPKALCEKILKRICKDNIQVTVDFSSCDTRFANTCLIAAESIRAIPGAKIYTSFNEFVDWMQTVFGYTYYLSNPVYKRYIGSEPFSGALGTHDGVGVSNEMCPDTDFSRINFEPFINSFVVYSVEDKQYHTKWAANDYFSDWTAYNNEESVARTDKVYMARTIPFVIEDGKLVRFYGDINRLETICQTVHFVHRSELFSPDAPVKKIRNARDLTFSIDNSIIYSSVNIGYEKQDYESLNGRDEFNFNNTYSTGHTIKEKKLSMISKYRADCYGIEFAVQARGNDTTDSSSDNDVFFILTRTNEKGMLVPDRSVTIVNALSDAVFNGSFSPMACVLANAGYIGIQAKKLYLEYASSEGNSNVVIGDHAMDDDIELDTPLMTCGRLTFTTDDIDDTVTSGCLVEVESGGVLYRGFIDEAIFKYAKNEAVNYQLYVKEICL